VTRPGGQGLPAGNRAAFAASRTRRYKQSRSVLDLDRRRAREPPIWAVVRPSALIGSGVQTGMICSRPAARER
jgi:hypothetical protein